MFSLTAMCGFRIIVHYIPEDVSESSGDGNEVRVTALKKGVIWACGIFYSLTLSTFAPRRSSFSSMCS